jgi:exodeoxyribonuclease VII large subunit
VFNLVRHARHGIATRLTSRSREVESLVGRMRRMLPDTVTRRQRVDDVLERGRTALAGLLRYRREQTNSMEAALAALNPTAVLERGFAVLTDPASGRTIASAKGVSKGDTVRARVRDGAFDAEVI